jgi:putative transcriptional regulator
LGSIGEEAYVICRKSGIIPDLEYASIHSAFEAGIRGVSSTVLVSNRRFHYLISDIKDLQNRYRDVNVRIKYL